MATHKSAKKRIKQNIKKRLQNRYYAITMRNALRKFRLITDKKEAEEKLPKMASMIDILAKKSIIHDNKASNLKAQLNKQVNAL